ALSTAGAMAVVTRPATTKTSRPTSSDTTLKAGHGTPAMDTVVEPGWATASRNCSAVVTKVTTARTQGFG
ncbi:hypothetical protein C6A85_50870, partial [Mycobacterium sp. ITM-2017-0098]